MYLEQPHRSSPTEFRTFHLKKKLQNNVSCKQFLVCSRVSPRARRPRTAWHASPGPRPVLACPRLQPEPRRYVRPVEQVRPPPQSTLSLHVDWRGAPSDPHSSHPSWPWSHYPLSSRFSCLPCWLSVPEYPRAATQGQGAPAGPQTLCAWTFRFVAVSRATASPGGVELVLNVWQFLLKVLFVVDV